MPTCKWHLKRCWSVQILAKSRGRRRPTACCSKRAKLRFDTPSATTTIFRKLASLQIRYVRAYVTKFLFHFLRTVCTSYTLYAYISRYTYVDGWVPTKRCTRIWFNTRFHHSGETSALAVSTHHSALTLRHVHTTYDMSIDMSRNQSRRRVDMFRTIFFVDRRVKLIDILLVFNKECRLTDCGADV